MIRILAVGNPRIDGVEWWRSVRPLTELQRSYPDIQIKFVSEKIEAVELLAADMIIMFRPVRPTSLSFLEKCKEPLFNLKIIIDIDDNLWRVPQGHPSEIDYAQHRHTLDKIYSLADGIWCSTEPIMPFADAMDGRGVVIPNAILARDLPDNPCQYRSTVCWRGSLANSDDIESDEATQAFAENYEKFNRWLFWGHYPKLLRGDNTRGVRYVETLQYMSGLKNSNINVMWKPLQENPFNDAKSNIAFIEATIAGGVCVSNYAGKPGWEMALPEFSNNPDFIAHHWELSRDWILKHYNLRDVNEKRYQHILKILGQ